MARGSGANPLLKKKSTVVKSSDQNSDITVFAEENFSGNSQTFEVSNSQFKTNFDICFKDPVKSIIVSGRYLSSTGKGLIKNCNFTSHVSFCL